MIQLNISAVNVCRIYLKIVRLYIYISFLSKIYWTNCEYILCAKSIGTIVYIFNE
jgi:hypothetical protein